MKIEFLSLSYVNTAPGTGNRLVFTLASGIQYKAGIYLKWLEFNYARIYDTVTTPFGERNITSANVNILATTATWMTPPIAVTLDPNTVYLQQGIGYMTKPDNLPARIELGDIYIPATGQLSVNGQIYCPGFINTDRVDFQCRLAFQFEATETYYVNQFDINDPRY